MGRPFGLIPLCAAIGASAWALAETAPRAHVWVPLPVPVEAPIAVVEPTPPPVVSVKAPVGRPLRTPLPRVARVSGQAVDGDGHGVTATLSFAGGLHHLVMVDTDDHGAFSVDLPPGTYQLHASDGNAEEDQELAVVADEERGDLLVALRATAKPEIATSENEESHCECDRGHCACDVIEVE